jgi:hypothetical protein
MLRLILLSLSSALLVLCFATSAMANDVFIYYKNSGTDATTSQYNNLKSELEDLGFTVTGSTSGSVSSNDVSGKELVIDISGTSNCGSTCKTVYDNYVSGGGKLLIVGSRYATNRNGTIEALIETKMSVGSFTQAGSSNGGYQNIARGDYASSTASENILPGTDKYMYNITGGTMVTANTTTSSIEMMHKWDYGSNGGAVYVTFGYGQFLSTHMYASNMVIFVTAIMGEEGLYTTNTSSSPPTPIYSSGMSSTQTTRVNSAISNSTTGGEGHKVTATIDGNTNDIYIEQAGEANYLLLSVTGGLNAVDIKQDATTSASYGHFVEVTIDGDSNSLDILQSGSGHKSAFVDINGNNNTADVTQKDGGGHYLQLDLIGDGHDATIIQEGSGSHAATVELTNAGGAWDFDLTQSGTTNKEYSLPHSMSDSSTTTGTCYVAGGCSLTVLQQD